MDYAFTQGIIDINPVARMNAVFMNPVTQNRPALPPSDLHRVMKAISMVSSMFNRMAVIDNDKAC